MASGCTGGRHHCRRAACGPESDTPLARQPTASRRDNRGVELAGLSRRGRRADVVLGCAFPADRPAVPLAGPGRSHVPPARSHSDSLMAPVGPLAARESTTTCPRTASRGGATRPWRAMHCGPRSSTSARVPRHATGCCTSGPARSSRSASPGGRGSNREPRTTCGRWSDPVVLLRPTLLAHRDAKQGEAVPQPMPGTNTARLPLAALLQRRPVHVPDCGFNEPEYVGVADGPGPEGPFEVLAPSQS